MIKNIIIMILLIIVISRCDEKEKISLSNIKNTPNVLNTGDNSTNKETIHEVDTVPSDNKDILKYDLDGKMQQLIAELGGINKIKLNLKIMATLPSNPECRIAESKRNSITTKGIYCLDPSQYKYIQVDIPN